MKLGQCIILETTVVKFVLIISTAYVEIPHPLELELIFSTLADILMMNLTAF
jgi:hypothetical protein